jgi:multicomponent Na+:H+ antiporter subunit E
MRQRVVALAWLLFVWLALIGNVTVTTVATGLAIGAGLLVFFRPTRRTRERIVLRPLRAASYFVYFQVKFLAANVQVALAVIRPGRGRARPGVIAVPIVAATELTTIVLANAVSLTPGTFIIELRRDPAVMYVHLLQVTSVRAARLAILEMERRIVRAFGPPGSAERVEALMAAVAAGGGEGPWTPSP